MTLQDQGNNLEPQKVYWEDPKYDPFEQDRPQLIPPPTVVKYDPSMEELSPAVRVNEGFDSLVPLPKPQYDQGQASIADRLFGLGNTPRYQTWPERMAKDFYGALTEPLPAVPGSVPGKVDEESQRRYEEDLIKRSASMIAPVGGASVISAARAMGPDAMIGVFGGVASKASNTQALGKAATMAREGIPREQIWKETGWYKGSDDLWRHEIDSSEARIGPGLRQMNYEEAGEILKKEGVALDTRFGKGDYNSKTGMNDDTHSMRKWGTKEEVFRDQLTPEGRAAWDTLHYWKPKAEGSLPDYLDFPSLYKNYPELKDLPVFVRKELGPDNTWHGAYNSPSKEFPHGYLELNASALQSGKDTSKQVMSVILHEVQHRIQDIEGFHPGPSGPSTYALAKAEMALVQKMVETYRANPNDPAMKDMHKLLNEIQANKEAFGYYMYRRQPKEVEARQTEYRRLMTQEQKDKLSPPEVMDLLSKAGKEVPEFHYPGERPEPPPPAWLEHYDKFKDRNNE